MTSDAGSEPTDPDQPPPARRFAASGAGRGAPSRTALTLVVVPLIAMVIASYIGGATGVWLVNEHPLVLMMLTSQIRWLVGAVNHVGTGAFFVVGLLRNLAPDPFFYLLGYWYGDSAVRWMEQRTTTIGQTMRALEQSFGKWGRPLVFIAPNNPVCLLAGAAAMNPIEFGILNVTGTLARLVLIKILGKAFETPINWVLHLLAEYRVPLLIVSVVAVGISMLLETRKGTSEIQQLRQLEHELDGEVINDDDGSGGAGS